MLTRRGFLHGSTVAIAGLTSAPLWLSRATAATSNGKRKILIPIFQRRRGGRLECGHPVCGQTLLRASSHYWDSASGRRKRIDRFRRTLCPQSRFAGAKASLGQTPARNRGSDRFSRSYALSFRCAGSNGIGNTGQGRRRRLVKPIVGTIGSGHITCARIGDGGSVA